MMELISDPRLEPIAERVARGERLAFDEGVTLFETLIRDAKRVPVEADSLYRPVEWAA